MAHVHVEDPERMNLLGLILAQVLERQLADDRRARWVRGLDATIAVKSGGMAVTVALAPGRPVRLTRTEVDAPTASMEAPLDVLADLALSRRLVVHALRRRFSLSGNLPTLLRFWQLLRVGRADASQEPAEAP
jgi:hypothetical protein